MDKKQKDMKVKLKHKQCMSHKNNLEPNIQCSREVVDGEDFCRYHKRYKKYMILDTKLTQEKLTQEKLIKKDDLTEDMETLMGYYDSWEEVPEKYRLKLTKWWDIRILMEIINNQLCTSDMNNPKPNFPFDPFTRMNFSPSDLDKIKNKIKELKLPVYIGLVEFLNCDYKKIYSTKNTDHKTMLKLVSILEKKLRFRIINLKNSQDCYLGIWVNKKDKYSEFEKLLNLYYSTSDHVIVHIQGDFVMMYNTKKDILLQKINSYPSENINLNDALYTCIL